MTRATRGFLVGAAAFLLLVLGTGLVAYYNGSLPISLGKSVNTELAYLPANASAVGYANVRSIMTSEFRQKLRQILPTGEEKEKLQAELGVDIEQDIDSVAAAYVGGATPFEGAVVVVRGRFNEGQIEAKAVEHGATVGEYRGKKILTMPADANQDTSTHHASPGVAFLDTGVLALGSIDGVKAAIDAGATGEDVRKNTELMSIINDLDSTGNAWFVGKVDAMTGQMGMPQELKDHIPAVELFAASVHVNGGLRGALRADARDEKAAEQLRDVVRGAVAAGKLMAGQNKQMDAILNSLQISGTGKTVGVTFSLPAEFLEVLNGIAAAKSLAAPPAPTTSGK
jgi:hypothetical protein